MKYLISFVILGCLISCGDREVYLKHHNTQAVDTIDLTKYYYITPAIRNGHEYLLYENYKYPRNDNYTFFLEHKLDCKKCLEQYD